MKEKLKQLDEYHWWLDKTARNRMNVAAKIIGSKRIIDTLENAAIEQLIKVAKSKQSLEKDLKATLKTMVGCCRSLGILVESKEPGVVTKEIDDGVYDKQIKEEAIEPSKEKLAELKSFFDEVQQSQEEQKKKEEEEKAKAEEEKTAAAAATAATPGAAPTAPVPGAVKKEEKK